MNHLYPTSHIKFSLGIFSKGPLRGCIQYHLQCKCYGHFYLQYSLILVLILGFIFFSYTFQQNILYRGNREKNVNFKLMFFQINNKKKICKLSFPSKGTYAYNLTARRIKVFFLLQFVITYCWFFARYGILFFFHSVVKMLCSLSNLFKIIGY